MEEVRDGNAKEDQIEDKSAEVREEGEKPPAEEAEETQTTNEEEIVRMQQELEEAKSQSEAATDMMLRLAAELDNYKKRVAKEHESLVKYAAQDIIQELVPILDNFDRAIESACKSKDFDSLLEGIRMISRQMYDALERRGVSKIDALGKAFDPNIHEAVMQLTSEEHPDNTVVEEFQKGYMLHDRIIRPAVVVVSKRAKEE